MTPLDPWTRRTSIAYFTMEIALRAEMHTWAGGLGVLAGDAARSAADLGLPMVFVTLASRSGYLSQRIYNGRQMDGPDPWEPASSCTLVEPTVSVRLQGREVWIRSWLYLVKGVDGDTVPVLLLDTDVDRNEPGDRVITGTLYGGDPRYRLKQEVVLGAGGVRLLRALGFEIATYHLNEGHAALLTTELMRDHDPAWVKARCVFTTHTPLKAGQDAFDYDLVRDVFADDQQVARLRSFAGDDSCNLTRLALNLSSRSNAVSRRHGTIARRMFPEYRIGSITNGVHAASWVHPTLAAVFDKHTPEWRRAPEELVGADQIPDAELVAAKAAAKAQLIATVAGVAGKRFRPDLPIIAFARRMTGYKRPLLILSDIERLRSIARRHPFQLIWAGKAHPADTGGKDLIRALHVAIESLGSDIPAAFLPGYDMRLAAALTGGADVWLNTPRAPLEASGTSGMKAALNGTLNLSVLDGWWPEAWIEDVTGWAIGASGDQTDAEDAAELYGQLEGKVLPLYHDDRPSWLWMVRQSISKIGPRFNSHRMMRSYATDAYLR